MTARILSGAVAVVLSGIAGLLGSHAGATCCIAPCWDCELQQNAQVTLVTMNRDQGEIEIIPNLRFSGEVERFAVVIPTPAEPRFAPAEVAIYDDLWLLTAPTGTRRLRSASDFGCGTFTPAKPVQAEDPEDVRVLSETRVGAFLATVVQSDSTNALLAWLNERGYQFTDADQVHVEPLVRAGWVFTAMELDTTVVEIPERWDHSVDPVALTFAADRFEVPVGFASINRDPRLQFRMVFFVLDQHRTALDGFGVTYANRISISEADAIAARYPRLASRITAGRFLTRLDAAVLPDRLMTGTRVLEWAGSDDEFRRVWGSGEPGLHDIWVAAPEADPAASLLDGSAAGLAAALPSGAAIGRALSDSIPGQLLLWLMLLAPLRKRLTRGRVR